MSPITISIDDKLVHSLKIKSTPFIIYSGPVPLSEKDYKELADYGIDIIWCLLEKYDHQNYTTVKTPIEDFGIPSSKHDFLKDLEVICNYITADKKVYIHCFAGHGRTGMAIAAILMKLTGISSKEALAITAEYCNGPESKEQKDFVRSLA